MRLALDVANSQVDLLAARLNGGAAVFYTASRPETPTSELELQQELVRVLLPSPAFQPAANGEALSHPAEPTPIAVTGEARWARLVTASGAVVADVLVRRKDEPDASLADAIFERTDFHRGGLCHLPPIVLRLPQSS